MSKMSCAAPAAVAPSKAEVTKDAWPTGPLPAGTVFDDFALVGALVFGGPSVGALLQDAELKPPAPAHQ